MLSPLSSNNNSSLSSNTTLVVVSEYKGIPYEAIVKELVQLLGGEPSIGERNQFYFTLVRYVRYICDFNAEMCVRVLPDFGLSHQERLTTATSSINRPRKGDLPDLLNHAITTASTASEGEAPASSLIASSPNLASCAVVMARFSRSGMSPLRGRLTEEVAVVRRS